MPYQECFVRKQPEYKDKAVIKRIEDQHTQQKT